MSLLYEVTFLSYFTVEVTHSRSGNAEGYEAFSGREARGSLSHLHTKCQLKRTQDFRD